MKKPIWFERPWVCGLFLLCALTGCLSSDHDWSWIVSVGAAGYWVRALVVAIDIKLGVLEHPQEDWRP